VVTATKNGTKEKLAWLPKICTGSKGTFPPEPACLDLQILQKYIPSRFIDIDKLNKVYMHERFGANQQTNKTEKRPGPSILCSSSEPHSTIALIYKRPIVPVDESSDDSDDDDDKENRNDRGKPPQKYRVVSRPQNKTPFQNSNRLSLGTSLITPRTNT